MNKDLLGLASVFEKRGMLKQANDIYGLLKFAQPTATQQQNRDFFVQKFPEENVNKVYAIADQYHRKFKDTPEYLKNLDEVQTINDVIKVIQEFGKIQLTPREQKIEEFKKAYPKRVAEIEELATSNVEPQNYDWVMKILLNQEEDPMHEIIKSVIFHEKNREVLDRELKTFESLSDLRAYFDEKLANNKEYYLEKIKPHALDPKNTSYIYDSDNFTVVLSGTVPSSQYWASGTTWCTSFLENNQFAHYSSRGIYLYYIITKPTSSKYDRSNSKRKMSLGYVKRDGKSEILLSESFATVDVDNHALNLTDISEYLSEESKEIFAAIDKDIERRDDTKFNQIITETTRAQLEEQLRLINDDSQVRALMLTFARASDVRPGIIDFLISYPNQSMIVHSALAKRKDLSPNHVLSLAKNDNENIRSLIAERKDLSTDVQMLLLDDQVFQVKYTLLKNKSVEISPDHFRNFVKDKNDVIRSVISMRRDIPDDVKIILSNDSNYDVKKILVQFQKSLPLEAMLNLIKDNNAYLTNMVVARLDAPPEVLSEVIKNKNNLSKVTILSALRNPNLSFEDIKTLSSTSDKEVRRAIASNPSTPSRILNRLSRDHDMWVKIEVARNENTPSGALLRLARDQDRYVVYAVATNINLPYSVIRELIRVTNWDWGVRDGLLQNEAVNESILEKLSNHHERRVRYLPAECNRTPIEILSKLSEDPEAAVRRRVAENESTSPEILERLSKDQSVSVREIVAENLNTPENIIRFLAESDPEHRVRQSALISIENIRGRGALHESERARREGEMRLASLRVWLLKRGFQVESGAVKLLSSYLK